MKSQTMKVLRMFALCIGILFFSKNASACVKDTTLQIYEMDSCSTNDMWLYATYKTGYSYQWSGNAFSSISSATGIVGSGTYSVTITNNATNCKDTLTITVVDDTCGPCSNFSGYIYENDGCQLNDIVLSVSSWGGSYSHRFLWNNGSTNSSNGNLTSGSYSVIITDTLYGCKDTLFYNATDDTCNPCANFNAWISENDGCQYNDVTLSATPKDSITSGTFTFMWNTGATTSTIGNRTSGSYWVIVTNTITGCKDTAYLSVSDDTCNPCANMYLYLYKYDACLSNDVQISASAYKPNSKLSYLWNTGSTASYLTNKTTGWYMVTVTDSVSGCVKKDTIYAYDSVYKCCKAYIYEDSSTTTGATKTFIGTEVSSTGGIIHFTWNFGDGSTDTGIYTNHTYTNAGTYTVCLYTNNITTGCKDTVCINVTAPAPGKNLKVSHYGGPYILPINKKWTYVYYRNIGTTTESSTLEYRFPIGCSINSTSIATSSVSGNVATFNLGTLAPGDHGYIYIQLNVPSTFGIGSSKCDTAQILTLTSDIDVSNNTSIVCQNVVSSYDPNDKTPYPLGTGPDGNIDPATKEINYLINFQNEGNWRTYKVRVEDEIDPSFDINTLAIGDISHSFRLVKSGRKLTFHFDDIELTPKSENEAKSKGYIQYSLKLNSNLPIGTQVKNTAYIYFDQNPAIITNTAKNTLKSSTGTVAVREAKDKGIDFDVVKTDDGITITADAKMSSVKIFDLNGRILETIETNSMKAKIDSEKLTSGIYIIHVEIGENTVVKKFKF